MPNLDERAVAEWFTAVRPATDQNEWPPAIRAVETTADMPLRLAEMGQALDDLATADLDALATALRQAPLRADMGRVMAQLGAARVMRLLHWLAESGLPECHTVIAALLQDEDSAGAALRAAVTAVTRRTMLHRMFAADRIAALETACTAAIEGAV